MPGASFFFFCARKLRFDRNFFILLKQPTNMIKHIPSRVRIGPSRWTPCFNDALHH